MAYEATGYGLPNTSGWMEKRSDDIFALGVSAYRTSPASAVMRLRTGQARRQQP